MKVILMKVKVEIGNYKSKSDANESESDTYESRLGRAVHCQGRTLTSEPVGHT